MGKTRNFIMTPGATAPQQDRHTAIQCFSLLFTISVWQFIVEHTNTFAEHKISTYTRKFSLYRNWVPVSIEEMKTFVAVILNKGIFKLSKLEHYWCQDLPSSIPFFTSNFHTR